MTFFAKIRQQKHIEIATATDIIKCRQHGLNLISPVSGFQAPTFPPLLWFV
jgi:hypothetical protein